MSLKERTYSILVVSSTDSFASAFAKSTDLRYTAEPSGYAHAAVLPLSISWIRGEIFWVAGSESRQRREGRGCLRHR